MMSLSFSFLSFFLLASLVWSYFSPYSVNANSVPPGCSSLSCPLPGNVSQCFNEGLGYWSFNCLNGFYFSGSNPNQCLGGYWMTSPPSCILPSFAGCIEVAGTIMNTGPSSDTDEALKYGLAQCPSNMIVIGGTAICDNWVYSYGPTPNMQGYMVQCLSNSVYEISAICCPAAVDTFADMNKVVDTAINDITNIQLYDQSQNVSHPLVAATESVNTLMPSGSFFQNCEYVTSGLIWLPDSSSPGSVYLPGLVLVAGVNCWGAISSLTVNGDWWTATCFGNSYFAGMLEIFAITCDPVQQISLSSVNCPYGGCSYVELGYTFNVPSGPWLGTNVYLESGPYIWYYGQTTNEASWNVHFSVWTGYSLPGSTITCSASDLPEVLFGGFTPIQESYDLGQILTLSCPSSFYIVGPSQISCTANGFSPSPGACQKLDQTGCYTHTEFFWAGIDQGSPTTGVQVSCPSTSDGQPWIAVHGGAQCQTSYITSNGYFDYIADLYPMSTTTWYAACSAGGGDGPVGLYAPAAVSLICCPAVAPILNTCSVTSSSCGSGQFTLDSGFSCGDKKGATIVQPSGSNNQWGFPPTSTATCWDNPGTTYNLCCNVPQISSTPNNQPLCTSYQEYFDEGYLFRCGSNQMLIQPGLSWSFNINNQAYDSEQYPI